MRVDSFHYHLPSELIAQKPLERREDSRMMILDRGSGNVLHEHAGDIAGHLSEGDVVVVNDTRVIPARVRGRRSDTGGRVELLFIEPAGGKRWKAMYKASRRARRGIRIVAGEGRFTFLVEDVAPGGTVEVSADDGADVETALRSEGEPPLPPYIRRAAKDRMLASIDSERYQTVYARAPGAIAAPTAGLHLTEAIFDEIKTLGARVAPVTLHVGPGTFVPVRTENVEMHDMEAERYEVPEDTARAVNLAKDEGRRVVAVGTTSVRTLESVADESGYIASGAGRTRLFIYPGYEFRVVDAMLTNFHLPESTLLMLVCAFAGKEHALAAYRQAIESGYRFYSYGDCMLIK
ncbi:MAG: tRNA preQ1(34) S-adenosylmethionine ribosyltransferase-isomerase QueA [Verrucomicrobiota bacterium]